MYARVIMFLLSAYSHVHERMTAFVLEHSPVRQHKTHHYRINTLDLQLRFLPQSNEEKAAWGHQSETERAGRTSRREPLSRAQGRWKEVRQERMWQPKVAPLCPHARQLIMRPRRTAFATFSRFPSALSNT